MPWRTYRKLESFQGSGFPCSLWDASRPHPLTPSSAHRPPGPSAFRSISRVAPFFPMLLLHTRRAMTEIGAGVRRDSLALIDLWIDKCPALVHQHGSQLMDNFLRLVSSECRGGRGDMAQSSWNTTSKSLLENPNDQMASVDGRMAVFRRESGISKRWAVPHASPCMGADSVHSADLPRAVSPCCF